MMQASRALIHEKVTLTDFQNTATLLEEELKSKDKAIEIGCGEELRLRRALKMNKTMGK